MEGTHEVVDRLRAAQESLEEVTDLLDSLYSGEAQIVRDCTRHDKHRGFNPEFEVTYVEFQARVDSRKVVLACGHQMLLTQEMVAAKGESLPCVYCAEECDWLSQ